MTTSIATHPIDVDHLSISYGRRTVIADLTTAIPRGSFTVIIGPNACGKSTLLRALCGVLPANSGEVRVEGRRLGDYSAKALARTIGILPQTATAPDGITVVDLVSRGRHPHRSTFRTWTSRDQEAVESALARTSLLELSRSFVSELSGGQRQRVWIAMALAQETPLLLLDEPTTFLDVAHQIDVLNLCTSLHREGRTIVAVLHDLNQAARYATHLIAMKDGEIVASGPPAHIVNADLVSTVFGLGAQIIDDPETLTPLVVPHAPEALMPAAASAE